MAYITSIPIIKPKIYTHQYSEGGLSTLTKTVIYILLHINVLCSDLYLAYTLNPKPETPKPCDLSKKRTEPLGSHAGE